MWVKLLVSKVINHKSYGKGDWVDVSTDRATKWVAAEHAVALDFGSILSSEGIGVAYPPSNKPPLLPFKNVTLQEGAIKPYFPRTLLLNAPYSIIDRDSPDLLRNAGRFAILFDLLNKWDVVLILGSFDVNASKVGHAEHERTQSIVHDLRVPWYQSSAVGVRDNEAGREFCAAWSAERAFGKVLAPLRAFYRTKPLAYFVPPSWGKVKEAAV